MTIIYDHYTIICALQYLHNRHIPGDKTWASSSIQCHVEMQIPDEFPFEGMDREQYVQCDQEDI